LRVLVGLGNPGPRYVATRHNIGSRIVHNFAKEKGISLTKSMTLGAIWGKIKSPEEEIRVLLPQRFMNLSGNVVKRSLEKWHVALTDVLVVVDDLHLPLGRLRVRSEGSDGGQKGLRSIIEALGTHHFSRLRVGIQSEPMKEPWETFVLKPFRRRELPLVEKSIEVATACCHLWIEEGIDVCMNTFNRKEIV